METPVAPIGLRRSSNVENLVLVHGNRALPTGGKMPSYFSDDPLSDELKKVLLDNFQRNRDRLLEHEVAHRFLQAVVRRAKREALMSSEHFSVDGTLIDAWASMKSFRPKDEDDDDYGDSDPPDGVTLAKAEMSDEVAAAYAGQELAFGPDYLIPTPFDPRLITTIPVAVAQAAMDSGVARRPIQDFAAYKRQLSARLDPSANSMANIFDAVRQNPQRVIFAEGEEEKVIRAAIHWRDNGYGHPILVGRPDRIRPSAPGDAPQMATWTG